MIGVDKISVVHGSRVLFQGVSIQIGSKDKVGLIGKNGAGKSTLLKIFAGELTTDAGSLSKPKDLTVGYLPQEMSLPEGKTVFEEASSAFAEMQSLEKELKSVNSTISERNDHQSKAFLELLNRQSDINEQLQNSGWFEIAEKVEKVLAGLGFLLTDFHEPTSNFSGGWRMRIELAKILLRNPGIVLLDEPTNHLDIESIQWLENFLKSLPVPVILISHDITFLDKITNRTIEISDGKTYDLPLPYSKFQIRKKEVRETLLASKKNQEKKIKDTEAFINRFRAKSTKAKQVQSRIKLLDKMDVIEIDEESTARINIRFPEGPRSGKIILEAVEVSKNYGHHQVLDKLEFIIPRGEKVAFVGKNGAGKTTLSKMIVGELAYDGELKLGHQVKIGYYAQDQSGKLNQNEDVFSAVEKENRELTPNALRTLLGAFLFSGDDQFKKVKVLSGGEKARLALCKLLLQPFNFLVLDEPTNHLDIASKEILKNALRQFKGSMVVVSHDRDFLAGLTDKVYEFTKGGIKQHIGDIREFLAVKKSASLDEISVSPEKKISEAGKIIVESDNKKEYAERKEMTKARNKINSHISNLESEIQEIELKIDSLNQKIVESHSYQPGLINEFQELQQKHNKVMQKWEEENVKLEQLTQGGIKYPSG